MHAGEMEVEGQVKVKVGNSFSEVEEKRRSDQEIRDWRTWLWENVERPPRDKTRCWSPDMCMRALCVAPMVMSKFRREAMAPRELSAIVWGCERRVLRMRRASPRW